MNEHTESARPAEERPAERPPREVQAGGEGEARRRRPPARRFSRRKVCRFCVDHTRYIDFKAYRMLRDFVTERGKMIPRRISGNCAKHQRMLSTAVKRARVMALLGFTHR